MSDGGRQTSIGQVGIGHYNVVAIVVVYLDILVVLALDARPVSDSTCPW